MSWPWRGGVIEELPVPLLSPPVGRGGAGRHNYTSSLPQGRGRAVQARPQLESTTLFQSLIMKRDHSAFKLNLGLLTELAPLHGGSVNLAGGRYGEAELSRLCIELFTQVCCTISHTFVTRVTRPLQSDCLLIQIVRPCDLPG